ncbi:MAG: magnesium-translocating P-type ATPase [Pyrinomonadaceae bacterium]|nr:magnesium-translocating P-type ATPase [Pyrinomonadaceae bacterium]
MSVDLKRPEKYWELTGSELLEAMRSGRDGLSSKEAARRLKEFGPNLLDIQPRITVLRLFFHQFTSPLVLILLFAVLVAAVVGEWVDAVVIATIVFGSALISFTQEYSAGNAVAKLRERLTLQVTAVRDGKQVQVATEKIVPGDIVLISAGSLIPADGVILEAKDCYVNQAVLTGESFPVEKTADISSEGALDSRTNCVFMGTSARSGTATVLIVNTGQETEYGAIADLLARRMPETEFERGIRRFGMMLTSLMLGLFLVVFAVNILSDKPAIASLLFAIALAVGISPELLPAIISINLSKGARTMAKRGVIVRRLNAIENLGSMDVLCTDKTGTLTEGTVRLEAAVDTAGNGSDAVFRLAFLNAALQSGLVNPLDEAITASRPMDISKVAKVGEVPYDFIRKRLSVAVREADGQTIELVLKGAFDNVVGVCTRIAENGSETELNEKKREALAERYRQWGAAGIRVLGIATRELEAGTSVTRHEEREMTFRGFALFLDPPKPDARGAITELARLHVDLKVITGDNRYVAAHIADSVGLSGRGMLTGPEIGGLTEEALWHAVDNTTVFAEVDPSQKERIIRALQKMGHVVGYMGDGINDAPALHEADVGISVDGAVDVAREAADLVLLKKGLHVLRKGIEEGRATFANSLKYVFTTTSANFGNMLSMAGASVFLPFLPLLAKQILLNNFLSDIPAIAIASDNVDSEYIHQPHRWDIKFIRNFMIAFGLVSSFFDFLMFGLLIYVVKAAEPEFQTAWFIESLLTELFVALVVRTRRPFYQSKPGFWLTLATAVVALVTIVLPYIPFASVFGFVPLPVGLMLIIGAVTLGYIVATELMKHLFYRLSFGRQRRRVS